jgi:tetratricopeptide (TPR) repeat protein
MTSKIDFYREVLADDPNSRVFFPLARMLAEAGETGEAVEVLKRSIGFHPGHVEAKFLLIELLSRLGCESEAASAFEGVAGLLSNYPAVWSLWAAKATGLSPDASIALRILAAALGGQDISFSGLLERGLGAPGKPAATPVSVLSGKAADSARAPSGEPAEPQGDFSALRGADEVMAITQQLEAVERRAPVEALPPECASQSSAAVKTRTMADLLARHGDYASALQIYGELQDMASSDQEKARIAGRIAEIKAQMAAGAAPAKPADAGPAKSKAKLVSMLEALANRLDARATA